MTLTTVSTDEVVDAIVAILARAEKRQPSDVMEELRAHGPDLAIDSLRIVEILTAVEAHYEVGLPADPVTARSTRSVASFARTVVEAIIAGEQA